jgi:hypothetical protein
MFWLSISHHPYSHHIVIILGLQSSFVFITIMYLLLLALFTHWLLRPVTFISYQQGFFLSLWCSPVVSMWFPTCTSLQRAQWDGQRTYNITLRHVCITIVTVGNKYYIFRVCVCSLSYPACQAHAQYHIVICGLSVCLSPPYFSTLCQMVNFQKNVTERTKCVFWFCLKHFSF